MVYLFCAIDKKMIPSFKVSTTKNAACYISNTIHCIQTPPVGTGLPDPNRQMRRQTSLPTLANPSAHSG
jgi:hypothetical protein